MTDHTGRTKRFFKRQDWHKISGVRAPLWHQFDHIEWGSDREDGATTHLKVVAVCGYSHYVSKLLTGDGLGFSAFSWKDDVKTRGLRCSRCDAKMDKRERTTMLAEMKGNA